MRKSAIAATSILGLSAFAASILVGQQQEVQALSLGSSLSAETAQPTETAQPEVTETATSQPSPTEAAVGSLVDGEYISTAVNYKYGTIQLGVAVSGGAIASVDLIQASTKGRGYDQAPPMLVTAALEAQGASFGNLSGATYTTEAFKQALENALDQATQN